VESDDQAHDSLVAIPDEWVRGPVSGSPAHYAALFMQALADPSANAEALDSLVTPESRPAWGDFTAAAEALNAIVSPGLQTRGVCPAPDVAYVGVMSGVTSHMAVLGSDIVPAAAVITLVLRPEHGRWMVHQWGDYAHPDSLPRTWRRPEDDSPSE
jgi:hypothetical protein